VIIKVIFLIFRFLSGFSRSALVSVAFAYSPVKRGCG
jgi:hypothetical protein